MKKQARNFLACWGLVHSKISDKHAEENTVHLEKSIISARKDAQKQQAQKDLEQYGCPLFEGRRSSFTFLFSYSCSSRNALRPRRSNLLSSANSLNE